MADAKVSELTSATSAGGSDVFYVVQSNTSKKISAANLFGNISNPTLTGNIVIGGTPQTLGSPGIISITTPITHLSSDAIGGTLQIPSGTQGQFKLLTMTATAGGSYTVATSNIAGNTNIVFDAVGDTVLLYFTNGKWAPVASSAALDLTSISSNVIPSANSVYDLGSVTNQWRSLYVSNNTIFIGGTPLTIVNGELVIGSGESSANLATVAYVDGAVANAGGGNTGDITFVGSTISSSDDMTIEASESLTIAYTDGSTSESVFSAEQGLASITVIDSGTPGAKLQLNPSNVAINNGQGSNPIDLTVSGNVTTTRIVVDADNFGGGLEIDTNFSPRISTFDTMSLGSRSAGINLSANATGTSKTWGFSESGTLTTPGDIVVAGNVTGTAGANTLVLKAQPVSNTSIQLNSIVDSTVSIAANFDIVTDSSNTSQTWTFGTDGSLSAPGNITANGVISSDNGSGYQTLIDPDEITAVYNGDTIYTIAKGPGGGSINTQAGKSFAITTDDNNYQWLFGSDGVLTAPGAISATGNISGANLSVTGNISGNTAGFAIGYRDIPQVSFTGNATIATGDAGKHFYSTESTDYRLTIANNASQSFQVGAAITVVNQGTGNITIAQGSGVTLYLAGNATASNRIVSTFGMATIMKVATDTWFISGADVA